MADQGPVVVVDANDDPCVRSLFKAVAQRHRPVYLLRPYSLPYFVRHVNAPVRSLFRWVPLAENLKQQYVITPGLRRWPRASTAVLRSVLERLADRSGRPSVVVYTLPFYAPLAEQVRGERTVYFAYDPFPYYAHWNTETVAALENRLLTSVDAALVVSKQLEEDFRPKTRQAFHLPNAASDEACECPAAGAEVPEPLRGLKRPMVGCVGLISSGYDWDLFRQAAARFPDCSFVLMGEVTERAEAMAEATRFPNVHLAGHWPRKTAMACLHHFDVCLNPLSLTEMNQRRCPLRLFDYLCTDKPVLSTAIREAREMRPYVEVESTTDGLLKRLETMLAGRYVVDLKARREYMKKQTWAARAEQFERVVEGLS